MVNIKWCLNVRNGLEIVEPNENMVNSYLKMAEESLSMIKKNEESRIWTASTSYYTMYYSLYSVISRIFKILDDYQKSLISEVIKIGIKCGIHKCSIKFMKQFLSEFYDIEEVELIENAFDVRKDLQYYPDRLVDNSKFELVRKGAVDFFVKSKEILLRITEKQINKIRGLLEDEKNR